MGKLFKSAEDVQVGSTIKIGPNQYGKVVAPTTVTDFGSEVLGHRIQGKTVTIHTRDHDIETTLPCNVEIVD